MINKKPNGMQIKINLYFCTLSFNKIKNDRTNKNYKAICQYNRYGNGYVDFFISVGRYSFILNSLKVKENKPNNKTLFKIV